MARNLPLHLPDDGSFEEISRHSRHEKKRSQPELLAAQEEKFRAISRVAPGCVHRVRPAGADYAAQPLGNDMLATSPRWRLSTLHIGDYHINPQERDSPLRLVQEHGEVCN
jgi:hypothetical protein